MRLSSDEANDPFTKKFKDKVLEALLEEPETMAKFVHYALRMEMMLFLRKFGTLKTWNRTRLRTATPVLT